MTEQHQHPYFPDFHALAPEWHGDHAEHLYWEHLRAINNASDEVRAYRNTVYAMWLSSQTMKIGFTSNVKKRMTYHRQEARRHGIEQGHWWACAGFRTRDEARAMERIVLRQLSGHCLPGSREWFKCDSKVWGKVIEYMETVRKDLFDGPKEIERDLPYLGSSNHWVEVCT